MRKNPEQFPKEPSPSEAARKEIDNIHQWRDEQINQIKKGHEDWEKDFTEKAKTEDAELLLGRLQELLQKKDELDQSKIHQIIRERLENELDKDIKYCRQKLKELGIEGQGE